MSSIVGPLAPPLVLPLGDRGLLVRFSDRIGEDVSNAIIALADAAESAHILGVTEIVPNLVSVLFRYEPREISFAALSGEIGMIASNLSVQPVKHAHHVIHVQFDAVCGPDLDQVAETLGLDVASFVEAHNNKPLRVLSTGFAPGFVYCGLHPRSLWLPRRTNVRASVSSGSILFAAGQTAMASTAIPTGWHVIGRTEFSNFDAQRSLPTVLRAGDTIEFRAIS